MRLQPATWFADLGHEMVIVHERKIAPLLIPGLTKALEKEKEKEKAAYVAKQKGVKFAVRAQAENLANLADQANLEVPEVKQPAPKEREIDIAPPPASLAIPRVLANRADGPTVPTALLGNQLHTR